MLSVAVLAAGIGCFGVAVGYAIGVRSAAATAPAASPGVSATSTAMPVPALDGAVPNVTTDTEIASLRRALASDPGNLAAAVQLADLLDDAGRWGEAVPYYEQVFKAQPGNVDVSTDLGTAHYHGGNTDAALRQYEQSLAIDPAHEHTLFILGVVRLEGKSDAAGAVKAWERLLELHPAGPHAVKVRERLTEARRRLTGLAPIPLQPSR